MRIGLVLMTVGAHGAHTGAHLADPAGVRCKLRGRTLGLAAEAAGTKAR
jgi:hypothetical protein